MKTEIKVAIIAAIALILATAMQILGPAFINSSEKENAAISSEPLDYSTHINITNNQEVMSQGYAYAARSNS